MLNCVFLSFLSQLFANDIFNVKICERYNAIIGHLVKHVEFQIRKCFLTGVTVV